MYKTIKAFNSSCIDCRQRDSRPMVWTRQSPGRELVDHGPDWIYALVPHCQPCFKATRGGAPASKGALWAARDAAAHEPFQKNLTHDLDPLD
jgi:hypothetical protein